MASAAASFEEWLSLERVRTLSDSLQDPAPVAELRREAYERFTGLPLEPNPLYRRYGYFSNVDLTGLEPAATSAPVEVPPPIEGAIQIVHDASGTRVTLPESVAREGVTVTTLPQLWRQGPEAAKAFARPEEEPADRLTALATALLNRGYRLDVPDRCRVPIRVQEVSVLSAPHEALVVRRSIRAGADAQLLVSEEAFSGPADGTAQRLLASTTDLDLGDGAKVVHLGVHAVDLRAVSVYRRSARTGPASRLAWIWNGVGGFRTKLRNRTRLEGPGSIVDDLQTFYGARDQSYDSSVDFTHVGTDTHGSSITRGVFTDDARGMSRGLVRIEPDARKTIAYVSEHAMLLSRGARSDTIPILEILCRDVKATHSTSVHPVDPEKIFYLQSRGIATPQAIRMIGEGFLSYVAEHAPIPELRELLYPALEARWNGEDIRWRGRASPTLPALSVTGTESAPEWRFDSKLR